MGAELLTIETRRERRCVPCSCNDYGYTSVYRSYIVDTITGTDIAGPYITGERAMNARDIIWSKS